MPDSSGRLTRQEMEAIIDRGESIIHQGVHIKDKALLPLPIDLAVDAVKGGNDSVATETVEDLDEQIAALQAQKERVSQAKADADKAEAAAKKAAASKLAPPAEKTEGDRTPEDTKGDGK